MSSGPQSARLDSQFKHECRLPKCRWPRMSGHRWAVPRVVMTRGERYLESCDDSPLSTSAPSARYEVDASVFNQGVVVC